MVEPMSDERDAAVVLGCDANYLPFALFLIWQILSRHPRRRFDLIIAANDSMALPDWAIAAGVRVEVIRPDARWAGLNSGQYGPAVYLPLYSVGRLAGRYRRILCLDSDIWFEGGDLDRLLRIDMGPHAVAGVRDVMHTHEANHHAREFQAMGLPALPYFNSGVLIYDTAAYVAQDVEERLVQAGLAHPETLRLADQALLNITLQGKLAEIAPSWNWMSNTRLAMVTQRYPVHFRHFCGKVKPWSDPSGFLDCRFATGYAEFFREFLPDAANRIGPRASAQYGWQDIAQRARWHLSARARVDRTLSRFTDDWQVHT